MLYLKQCAAYDQPHCPAVLASQECQLHSVALILDRIIIGTDHLHAFCYIKILIALFIRQLDDISLFQGFQVRKISSMSAPIVTCMPPDDERRTIGVQVTAKSTLAATNPVATALYVTSDGNGELVVAEMVPQVPGQMNMDGTQQEAPKLLKLVQHG